MVSNSKATVMLLVAGLLAVSILLIRFAVDFRSEGLLLAVPFWLLVGATLLTGWWQVLFSRAPSNPQISGPSEGLLLAVIPLSLLASSLDCTGLSFYGCTPFCSFIKLVWIPVTGICCLLYWITKRSALLICLALAILVPLWPHCLCYNLANAWWIDRIGASPMCYSWGTAAGVTALVSISSGRKTLWSIILCYAITAGAAAFFIGHHYLHFPW